MKSNWQRLADDKDASLAFESIIELKSNCPTCNEVMKREDIELPSFDAIPDSFDAFSVELECECGGYEIQFWQLGDGLMITPDEQIENTLLYRVVQEGKRPDDIVTQILDSLDQKTYRYCSFFKRIDEIRRFNDSVVDFTLDSAYRRLLYFNAVSVMEHYLKDVAIEAVRRSKELVRRVIVSQEYFKTKQTTYATLLKRMSQLDREVADYLKGLLFHDLRKVVVPIFTGALQVRLLKEKFGAVMRATENRHDIAHRDGRNSQGVEFCPTSDDVGNVLDNITDFVRHIDRQLIQKYPELATEGGTCGSSISK